MTRDALKVLALLQSMNEWIPGPQTHRSNPLCHRPDSGEAPSATIPCESCSGKGTYGPKSRQCAHCKGAGTLQVDAYTKRELQTARGHLRAMTDTELDTSLRRLASQASIRDGEEATDWYTAASDRHDHLYRTGSYQDLEHALHRLEHAQPIAAGLVIAFLVYGSEAIRSARIQRVLDTSCELLAHWMPSPIRVPAWSVSHPVNGNAKGRGSHPAALGQRDTEIRRLRSQGWKISRLSVQFNLSQRHVKRIVAEQEAA